MPLRRHLILALPLCSMACARQDRVPPAPLALRLGTALEAADPAADALILRMDAFERLAMREDAAIAFALRSRTAASDSAAGAAEAAGRVLMPAFTALGDYAHGLALIAEGDKVEPRSGPTGASLMRMAEEALPAVQAASGTVVPEPVRTAGLAGIGTLSDLPDRFAARPGPGAQAMLSEAAPHVAAVVALMRAVIGPAPGQGVRGAIRARREALDATHARLLGAAATDRSLGPAGRYALYRNLTELREDEPAQGSFAVLIDLLDRLDVAHAALASSAPDAADKVTAFELAVARLAALAEAARQG